MKYLGVLLVGLAIFTLGCKTEEVDISVGEQFEKDINLIDSWLADNGITDILVQDPSLIRYTINEIGTGISPRFHSGDSIQVDYEGRLMDTGGVFDSGTAVTLYLDTTIRGWQIMLPEMREGDMYTIYLPSLYGYGPNGQGSIPPNAVIVFDIRLIKVSN